MPLKRSQVKKTQEQGLCNGTVSVRPSVCPSHSSAAEKCGGFAAVVPTSGRYRSVAARLFSKVNSVTINYRCQTRPAYVSALLSEGQYT